MKYVMWKITDEGFEAVAWFMDENMANECRDLESMLNDHYEVTKVGETPIW